MRAVTVDGAGDWAVSSPVKGGYLALGRRQAQARQTLAEELAWLQAPSKEDPQQSNSARLSWDLLLRMDLLRAEVETRLATRTP